MEEKLSYNFKCQCDIDFFRQRSYCMYSILAFVEAEGKYAPERTREKPRYLQKVQ